MAYSDSVPSNPVDRTAILAAHDAAVAEGADGYLDPTTRLFVFTSAYLASVGTCCGSGCRHCPYGAPQSDTRR